MYLLIYLFLVFKIRSR